MLDVSWSELLVIVFLAVLVIGPKDLPVIMRAFGRIVRRLQYVRFAFSQQFEDFMKENELNELRNSIDVHAEETDEAGADLEMTPLERTKDKDGHDV